LKDTFYTFVTLTVNHRTAFSVLIPFRSVVSSPLALRVRLLGVLLNTSRCFTALYTFPFALPLAFTRFYKDVFVFVYVSLLRVSLVHYRFAAPLPLLPGFRVSFGFAFSVRVCAFGLRKDFLLNVPFHWDIKHEL